MILSLWNFEVVYVVHCTNRDTYQQDLYTTTSQVGGTETTNSDNLKPPPEKAFIH